MANGRSFGDTDSPKAVTSKPHIKQMVIPEGGARLYLGSDGVWDVLSAKVITRACRRRAPQSASHLIIDRIVLASGGNPVDDATIMVIDINPASTDGCPKTLRKNRTQKRIFNKPEEDPFEFFCEIDAMEIRPIPKFVKPTAPVQILPIKSNKSNLRVMHSSATSLESGLLQELDKGLFALQNE